MLSQNYSKRYEGIIDDADMNLWPAPLKIAEQTINSMVEFRVRILCISISGILLFWFVFMYIIDNRSKGINDIK
jgi:hypothetical protein